MGFSVISHEPAIATGLVAGDTVAASSMESLLQRDRYLFATRRRLLASLPPVTVSTWSTAEVVYGFLIKLLPTSNGTIIIGAASSGSCDVDISTSYGSTTVGLTAGGPDSSASLLYGLPTGTWIGVTIQVTNYDYPTPVTVKGIYIVEQILDETQLP